MSPEAYVVRGVDVPCLPGRAHDPAPPDIEVNAEGILTGRTRVRCKVCWHVIVDFPGHETATYLTRSSAYIRTYCGSQWEPELGNDGMATPVEEACRACGEHGQRDTGTLLCRPCWRIWVLGWE